ncbi:acetyl-CoA synthetase-like protein [Ascodesmis nigricans]|uniref:Acetyl-CoA synthetase-like protein n=1 Tax=Ascodesmis nigricans TaxID=341454 RepID=A0A4S2MQ60_9PEZI|nr:acetyl-CoA synthetase-like protein [Ascodesmis nigricans]
MDNPELSVQLSALRNELEEGDITEKGYQKKCALLLAQYGIVEGPAAAGIDPRASVMQPPPPPLSHRASYLPSPTSGSYGSPLPSASVYGPPPDWGNPVDDPRASYIPQEDPRASYMPQDDPRASFQPTQDPYRHSSIVDSRSAHYRDDSYSSGTGRLHVRNFSTSSTSSPVTNPQPPQNLGYGVPPPEPQYSAYDPSIGPVGPGGQVESRSNTFYDSGGFFSDFTGQGGMDPGGRDSMAMVPGMPDGGYGQQPMMPGFSTVDTAPFSPTAAVPPPMLSAGDLPPPNITTNTLLPLEPRDVPFAVWDPHNDNIPMAKFDNIATVLRHRARTIPKRQAYSILDNKGKEVTACSWEKLASRAEKVAQVIRDKSNLYRGDRVALVYRDVELVDFAVSLLGCFIAGVVAVPINEPEDYQKLIFILTTTQAHLALTTDYNLKAFQRELTNKKLSWPRGVEWWKTNEFGSFHPRRKDDIPPLQVPDLAYIEFSRAPTGDLRGVVLSHRTIMHQMATLSAILATVPKSGSESDTFNTNLKDKVGQPMSKGQPGETLVTFLDPRQGIGLIHSVLLTVYGGQTTIWCSNQTATQPGLYANIITRHRATLCLADYPNLKTIVYNYQSEPLVTRHFQKKTPVDFSTIKLMMIDALTVDPEFHEILADRWLRPLGKKNAWDAVAPMLCLPEHGGMVISMRDWVGGEERMGCPLNDRFKEEDTPPEEEPEEKKTNGFTSSLLSGPTIVVKEPKKEAEIMEALLDKTALRTNDVVVLAIGEEVAKRADDPSAVRVGAFGYPIPDATLAVVDPETSLLAGANVVGEIWVDSPSLSGGFWAMPKQTETIFHARPYRFEEGNPNPVIVEPEFLRTGLLGCIIEGKVFVLGLYEDRLRQSVEWVDDDTARRGEEYRYFFVQHLVFTIMRKMTKIFDCTAFDVFVNDEHLPIIVLESPAASTAPTTTGGLARQLDTALLDSLSERCMEVLLTEHQLRVYCVMITAPNSLPRVTKNGRQEIGNMLCRKEFDLGTLPCVHVLFGVERAVRNLPIGMDPTGGVWSPEASRQRQAYLVSQDKQYSGVDYREVVIDDRTSTPLNNFSSIVDLLQWRVARQAEELSYCTIDGRGREGKGVTWKKLDQKIAAVASQIRNKWKISPGDHVLLIYTHSEEFLYALHACFCLGVIAVPLAPIDTNRLAEDIPALLHLVSDFNIKAILVNADVDHLLKSKPLSTHLKQSASVLQVKVPPVHNTAKPPRTSHGCRDLNFTVNPQWVQPGWTALVWTYWTPDQRRISVSLEHTTIMGVCKVMKETCQMTSSRPVIGCVRSTSGVGFVVSWLMGIFVGAPTYLVSPVDYAQNPLSLFLSLSRHKIKDTYATPQMLDHAIVNMPSKGFTLHELKNLMILSEGRPRPDLFQKVRLHFASAGLDRTAINTIYSHVLHPMVASRSYMCIEPIELYLDPKALRQGLIFPCDRETTPGALLVQDSGMVPVSTQIAIVNPETNYLCHTGELGEIWVQSEATMVGFYKSKDPFDIERFSGKTADGDPRTKYVRTGDLGFLHTVSRPIGPKGEQVEMQILFVLGCIGDTFEVNGLSHFPIDIERTIESSHRNIAPAGSAVFQAGGLVVVVVEVAVKSYLASMVPVIVNAILDQHQLVVDIVAFVGRGDFMRSRLGEKQRGKILANWVTRKLRTIAQFGIRKREDDNDITNNEPTNVGSNEKQVAGGAFGMGHHTLGSRPPTIRETSNTATPSKGSMVNLTITSPGGSSTPPLALDGSTTLLHTPTPPNPQQQRHSSLLSHPQQAYPASSPPVELPALPALTSPAELPAPLLSDELLARIISNTSNSDASTSPPPKPPPKSERRRRASSVQSKSGIGGGSGGERGIGGERLEEEEYRVDLGATGTEEALALMRLGDADGAGAGAGAGEEPGRAV